LFTFLTVAVIASNLSAAKGREREAIDHLFERFCRGRAKAWASSITQISTCTPSSTTRSGGSLK
jgi:hypothetical protein